MSWAAALGQAPPAETQAFPRSLGRAVRQGGYITQLQGPLKGPRIVVCVNSTSGAQLWSPTGREGGRLFLYSFRNI